MLAPAIGGAVGNAATQLACAQGAAKAISTTTSSLKATQARALGFEDVIDLSAESLVDGVARLTRGRGVDIVIDSVGGTLTGEALSTVSLDRGADLARILGGTEDDDRRHGLDLEASPHERVLPVRAITCGQSGGLGQQFSRS